MSTSVKVWSSGILMILAFVIGVQTETGPDQMTPAIVGAIIALGVWSLSVLLVVIGFLEGKRKNER